MCWMTLQGTTHVDSDGNTCIMLQTAKGVVMFQCQVFVFNLCQEDDTKTCIDILYVCSSKTGVSLMKHIMMHGDAIYINMYRVLCM
jgi:hypothetical protein